MSLNLPSLVRLCGCCDGRGEYEQMYTAGCGGGYYRSMGPCGWCKEQGFVYKATSDPVPSSVRVQIMNMNPDFENMEKSVGFVIV